MKRLFLIFRVLLFFVGTPMAVFFLSRLILILSILSQKQWSEPLALFVSALFCLPGALIVWRVFFMQKPKTLRQQYEEDAELLYSQVRDELMKVKTFETAIKAEETATLLPKICEDVDYLLFKVNEKTPNKRQSAAKTLGTHLRIMVQDVLPQYVEMQDHPQYYEEPAQKLVRAHQAMKHFDMFVCGSIKLLEDDDLSRFDIAIKILDPLEHVLLY